MNREVYEVTNNSEKNGHHKFDVFNCLFYLKNNSQIFNLGRKRIYKLEQIFSIFAGLNC